MIWPAESSCYQNFPTGLRFDPLSQIIYQIFLSKELLELMLQKMFFWLSMICVTSRWVYFVHVRLWNLRHKQFGSQLEPSHVLKNLLLPMVVFISSDLSVLSCQAIGEDICAVLHQKYLQKLREKKDFLL